MFQKSNIDKIIELGNYIFTRFWGLNLPSSEAVVAHTNNIYFRINGKSLPNKEAGSNQFNGGRPSN
jgi:hypothetical protein